VADRVRYLVMYDIRTPQRLRRVHDIAVDFGERLQYSVYICDLTPQQLVGFRARIREVIHLDEDSVSIFDLGLTTGRAARAWSTSVAAPGSPTRRPRQIP
jgi:CRISPR-associated protein Cas2